MKPTLRSQITDRSSRTIKAIFNDAAQVLGHDYRSIRPGEINNINNQLLTIIRKGGREGERAMNDLVKVNYLQVVSIAKKYSWANVEQIDLIQEGIIGVVEAVAYYENNEKFTFGAFAKSFIRDHISKAIGIIEKTIRLPENRLRLARRYDRFSQRFQQEFERVPTFEEFLEHEGITCSRKNESDSRMMFQDVMNAFRQPTSYDVTVDDEDGSGSVRMSELIASDCSQFRV